MFCDYHVHTHYSDDSEYQMDDVIQDAVKMKMDEICITDHVDYGIKVDVEDHHKYPHKLLNVDYPRYFQDIERLQELYPISIKKGMEFGMQTHTIDQYQKLFDSYPFDFIILSCHQVNDLEFWTQDFQKGKSQKEYYERYYQEILNVIQVYKDYSVLGHLDLIVRYDLQGYYPFENVKDIVTRILKTVIEDGKGIEVNTSSHRYGLKDMTPSLDILKLYKELGGKIITIGSDSHQKEHLGAYIEETKDVLRNLGYQYYCTFDHMQPLFHQL